MEHNFSSPEFINKLKAKEQGAVSHLVSKYSRSLYYAALSQGLDENGAEEVVQSTWDSFFTAIDRFEGRSHIRTYIFGILYNKIKENWRKQKKYVHVEEYDAVVDGQFDGDGQWNYAPISPERFSEVSESIELLQGCMEGLSEQQRMAFYMKEVEGEETNSICNALSVTHTNLRVLIYRAKNRLRKCLEGHFQEGGE